MSRPGSRNRGGNYEQGTDVARQRKKYDESTNDDDDDLILLYPSSKATPSGAIVCATVAVVVVVVLLGLTSFLPSCGVRFAVRQWVRGWSPPPGLVINADARAFAASVFCFIVSLLSRPAASPFPLL